MHPTVARLKPWPMAHRNCEIIKYCCYLSQRVLGFIFTQHWITNTERTQMMPSRAAAGQKISQKGWDWSCLRCVTTSGPIAESRRKLQSDWPRQWSKWDTTTHNSSHVGRQGRGPPKKRTLPAMSAVSNTAASLLGHLQPLHSLLLLATAMASAGSKLLILYC